MTVRVRVKVGVRVRVGVRPFLIYHKGVHASACAVNRNWERPVTVHGANASVLTPYI